MSENFLNFISGSNARLYVVTHSAILYLWLENIKQNYGKVLGKETCTKDIVFGRFNHQTYALLFGELYSLMRMLLFSIQRCFQYEISHSYNSVHRGTDIMTHIGQKLLFIFLGAFQLPVFFT